jgi:hypothetical protein
MIKKIIASAVIALGLAASGSASAIVVNGVDFGTPGTTHLETTTLAETYVNAVGQTLTGYGVVNTVNGNPLYATTPGQYLYFVLNYTVQTFSPTAVTFNNGTVSLYLNPFRNLTNFSSASNLTAIQGGNLWATLTGHTSAPTMSELAASGALTGAQLSFTGAGLLDIASGANGVFDFLNGNSIADGLGGFADIGVTTSGSNVTLNRNDNTASCTTINPAVGDWCFQGSADLRGNTVPEPGVLSLVGLGLLGMGAALRKRKSA